jgi:hypothetical protein
MNSIKFTSTVLNGSGKKGILKPDEEGYYTLVVGGLNTYNSAGEYYTLDGAKRLFESSSIFMRRVSSGCLKGEVGHPKQTDNMSLATYTNRVLSIEETNVCCHFKEVWLDYDYGKNNPKYNNSGLVAIMAKVKPAGPNGSQLKSSLDNPNENVCFSIRALTRDYYRAGTRMRVLDTIVTFDNVIEPGIATSTKYSSPALESLSETLVNRKQLEALLLPNNNIATESSKTIINEILISLDKNINPPIYNRW